MLILVQANIRYSTVCSIAEDREEAKASLLALIPRGYRGSPVTNVTLPPELVSKIGEQVLTK